MDLNQYLICDDDLYGNIVQRIDLRARQRLKENKHDYDRHVERLTVLQDMVADIESQIHNCLSVEKGCINPS